jgi:hypothetical protein
VLWDSFGQTLLRECLLEIPDSLYAFSGDSVFFHLAEMIPQLKSRAAKSGPENVPETGAKKKSKKK